MSDSDFATRLPPQKQLLLLSAGCLVLHPSLGFQGGGCADRGPPTWEAQPVFDLITEGYTTVLSLELDTASKSFAACVHRLRDENIAEGRILLACISHDLTCVHRGQRSDHDCLRFHFAGESGDVLGTGEVEPEPETVATVPLAALDESEPEAAAAVPSAELDEPEPETAAAVTSAGPETPAGLPCGPHGVTGISIRFLHPKQRHHMAARSHGYTDWITVPSTPESPSTCWASRMYLYFRASEMMVQSDDLLFCTSRPDKKHDNKCWGLSADAVANIMGRIMKEAGIPADFLPTLHGMPGWL